MKPKKRLFFYRLEPGRLLAELVQVEDRGKWITQLLIDLSTGSPTTPLAEEMMQESAEYSEVKRAAAKKRWDIKQMHVDAPDMHVDADAKLSNASSSNSSSNSSSIKKKRLTSVSPKEKVSPSKIPPAVSEVEGYMAEIGFKGNAERFIDYYEAIGWVIGNNKKMKDWKATVRNWKHKENDRMGKDNEPPPVRKLRLVE